MTALLKPSTAIVPLPESAAATTKASITAENILAPLYAEAEAKRCRCLFPVDAAIAALNAIMTAVHESGYTSKFVDTYFPPGPASLNFFDQTQHPAHFLTAHTWRRASDLGVKDCRLFSDGASMNDLKQGCVGLCHTASAMSSIAAVAPDHLRGLFYPASFSSAGVYGVRVWVPPLNEWRMVIVDDYVPVIVYDSARGTHAPISISSKTPGEQWPMIIEKALAKVCGAYSQLDATFVLFEGMHSLMGGDTFFARPDSPDEVAELLKYIAANKAAATAACGKGSPDLKATGLFAGHQYSVIRMVECEGHRLILTRNPHGCTEPTEIIPWSDESPLWDAHPNVANACGKGAVENDGVFWISAEDFFKYFGSITIGLPAPALTARPLLPGAFASTAMQPGKITSTKSLWRVDAFRPRSRQDMVHKIEAFGVDAASGVSSSSNLATCPCFAVTLTERTAIAVHVDYDHSKAKATALPDLLRPGPNPMFAIYPATTGADAATVGAAAQRPLLPSVARRFMADAGGALPPLQPVNTPTSTVFSDAVELPAGTYTICAYSMTGAAFPLFFRALTNRPVGGGGALTPVAPVPHTALVLSRLGKADFNKNGSAFLRLDASGGADDEIVAEVVVTRPPINTPAVARVGISVSAGVAEPSADFNRSAVPNAFAASRNNCAAAVRMRITGASSLIQIAAIEWADEAAKADFEVRIISASGKTHSVKRL